MREVEAGEEQRTKIATIVEDLKPGVLTFYRERETLRTDFVGALEADPVDPAELNRIREAGLGLADRAFAQGLDAVVKVSEVLTPEQRRQLAQAWRDHQRE